MKRLLVGLMLVVLAAAPASADPTEPTPSAPTTTPTPTPPPAIVNTVAPTLGGSARFEKTLVANRGTWSPAPTAYGYRWYRDGVEIPGARGATFKPRAQDVGHRIQARVFVARAGHVGANRYTSGAMVDHVTKVRRTVTYSVRTKGRITTSLATFKKQAQETFDDPRGWRSNGIRFKQVSKGGDFTLVLASAGSVRSYSSACSSQWSCRVGRNVIINQERWKHASSGWNKARGSLRDYRHMVVNHETGHWLGKGHVGCTKKGAKARVMMQQSKGLKGCKFNPWPTTGERYAPRFKF